MGRSANRKWAKRRRKFARAKVADRFPMWQLFGHHRKFWRAAAAVLCMAFVYTTAVHADAPAIGSQTITNDEPRGRTWITFWHAGPIDQAFELEQDGAIIPLESGAHVTCFLNGFRSPQGSVECNMDIPVSRDNAVLRVRPLGSTDEADWSNAWDNRAIPCGWFVGEIVFRNLDWSTGQVGEACTRPIVEPPPPVDPNAPKTPSAPRILKP